MTATKNKTTSLVDIKNEFSNILEEEKTTAIIPFLKSLTPTEKKALTPFLKKQIKYYDDYIEIKKGKWQRRRTEKHQYILKRAAMFCLDLKAFKSNIFSFDAELVEEITSFFKPKWLSKYFNDFGSVDFLPINLKYHWLLKKQQEGLIQPNEELLAKTLCNAILTNTLDWKSRFTPEKIEKYPITLEEHFWYFFQYETTVYSVTRWTHFKDNTTRETANWLTVILNLEKAGKLPRKRLLKESLAATNRNFNRNLILWYIDIFVALLPTESELIELQPELFQVFNAAQSKPINVVLKFCKKLVKSPLFDGATFLENAPILLASETKSIVSSTLMILKTLAQKQPTLVDQICMVVCDTFMHQTATLQTRAAKVLAKYGNLDHEELKMAIATFEPNLLSEAKGLLNPFIQETTEEPTLQANELYPISPEPILQQQNQIQFPETFDDLAFLANQALVGNNAWDLEILPAALLKFNHLLTEENCEKLTPALQRAYKYIFRGGGNKRVGHFERMAAHFLAEYAQTIRKRFPNFDALDSTLKSYLKKEASYQMNWKNYLPKGISLLRWKTYGDARIYKPFQKVLIHALQQLKAQNALPLLSTPTHSPYWIDPGVFVERLSQYQQADMVPNAADWQLAIARVTFENIDAAIQLAKSKLKGEFLDLTLFLLSNIVPKTDDLTYVQAWKVAALTNSFRDKNGCDYFFPKEIQKALLGEVTYQFTRETRMSKEWNYSKNAYENRPYTHKTLLVGEKTGLFPKLWNGIKSMLQDNLTRKEFFLFDFLRIDDFWSVTTNDCTRFVGLTPNIPTPIIRQITQKCLQYSEFWSETDKKAVRAFTQIFLENWRGGEEMAHLFLATTLTCSDKTSRLIAAELWLKGVSESTLDTKLLGQILGSMEQVEFFPLKRLLDSLQAVLFNVSDYHNRALTDMLTELICQMPEKPIRGTKALLEIYFELIGLTNQPITNHCLIKQFGRWKGVSSLKKVVAKLVELVESE